MLVIRHPTVSRTTKHNDDASVESSPLCPLPFQEEEEDQEEDNEMQLVDKIMKEQEQQSTNIVVPIEKVLQSSPQRRQGSKTSDQLKILLLLRLG